MRSVALALVALLLAGCAAPPEASDPSPPGAEATPPTSATPSPDARAKGPDWSFTAIDGTTYSRDSPAGNASVLFFMATWCGSCRSKAPMLADAHAAYAGKDVRMFSLDFDPSESKQDIERWQDQYDQAWPHGIDEGLRIQRALGVRSQSSVVVLDAEGQIVKLFGYGQVTREALDAAVADALARA